MRCFGLCSQNGESALHAAALFGHLDVVRELVAAGADTTLRNEDACTAAELAASRRYLAIADLLDKATAAVAKAKPHRFHPGAFSLSMPALRKRLFFEGCHTLGSVFARET